MIQPAHKTIFAVGAHPDDVEFGCGGILLKEAEKGTRIHILVCSKGESGTNGSAEERVAESEEAAKMLGAELRFIDLGGDGKIEATKNNALLIAQVVREVRPQIVLAPTDSSNQHPDHVAISNLVRDASRMARYGGIDTLAAHEAHEIEAFYQFAITPSAEFGALPDILVDISDVHDKWLKLMQCHQTQLQTRNYLELQESRARVWGLQCGLEFAQGLYSNDPLVTSEVSDLPPTARVF